MANNSEEGQGLQRAVVPMMMMQGLQRAVVPMMMMMIMTSDITILLQASMVFVDTVFFVLNCIQ
jgi:hypothetical protein